MSSQLNASNRLRVSKSQYVANHYKVGKPRKLGDYSNTSEQDGQGKGLRVLKLPDQLENLHFDLKEGYQQDTKDGCAKSGDIDKRRELDPMLKWVISNRDKLMPSEIESTAGRKLSPDFICSRGVLTQIMLAPYENYGSFLIGATKYKETVYMVKFATEDRKHSLDQNDEQEKLRCYSGFRFEKLVTEAGDVNHQTGYSCVIQRTVGEHSLVYYSMMKCVGEKERAANPRLSDFVEIKTTALKKVKYRLPCNVPPFKLLKWWTHSSVTGTEKVVCGYRDNDMILREVRILHVSDMENMTGKKKPWYPDVCHRFLGQFLDFVKETVTEDDHDIMYEFTWNPGQDVTWIRSAPSDDRHVIPDWYTGQL